jgi:hypothetical protein
MRKPEAVPENGMQSDSLAHIPLEIPGQGEKLTALEGRATSFPNRRRVLIIEDDASTRTMLYAFLTSMRCKCMATGQREAPALLRRKKFDAILVDVGPTRAMAKRFLPKLQKLRPDLMGKTLVITGGPADAPSSKVADSYALPHVSESALFQQLWINLQPLFSTSNQ